MRSNLAFEDWTSIFGSERLTVGGHSLLPQKQFINQLFANKRWQSYYQRPMRYHSNASEFCGRQRPLGGRMVIRLNRTQDGEGMILGATLLKLTC